MTLYAYRCPNCGHAFEQFASYQTADSVACPACHHPRAKRQLSRIAMRVVGRDGSPASSYAESDDSGSSCPTGTCPFV
jgi:putative FmdB family regulatory protein